ncbi:MAG: hypothetical protein EP326_13950 [Deltaproteobacteria bacterium]|nr:MAG: hypothetical protein EP326_13950 [Deltaproteobacteria bacterium]TNF30413.1 MAG: hypothetical protein EP319_05065 [Deltaproteobacteria bacterium]
MKRLILICLVCTSCAGPMSPFGAMPVLDNVDTLEEVTKNDEQDTLIQGRGPASINELSPVKISFSPDRQMLHDKSELKISVEDPDGMDAHHIIRFFYDGMEVTDIINKNSKKEILKDKVVYSIKDFRLIPERHNDIVVGYRRSPLSPIVYKRYQSPYCHWRDKLTIKNPHRFEDKMETIKIIENISLIEGVNPNFIAGLVAQESSFNPHAVSIAKAIGLTQVTSLAEEHVLQVHPEWPTYNDLNRYPVPVIKGLILTGQVNHENEWRLNPNYSIKGGIEYMEFIEDYWTRDENISVVTKHIGETGNSISDILLASYNSGPYRVKRSIIKKGKDWLQSRNLKEARKYVKRVKSYCYHFAKEDENSI